MVSCIDVLIFSNREDIRNRIWTLIKLHFQSRITSESSGSRIARTFQQIDPDILLLDLLEPGPVHPLRDGGISGEDIGEDTYVIILGSQTPPGVFDVDQRILIGRNPTADTILGTIEKAAKNLGFFTDQGKITERLVQQQIPIEIRLPEKEVRLEGITTGINQNGLGARVSLRTGSSSVSGLTEDTTCRVYFRDEDLAFEPVLGEIARIEESWDDRYDQFVVVSFDGADAFPKGTRSRRILEELIDQQNDVSIKRPGINNWF